MSKWSNNQIQGIVLLIAALLLFVPIQWINGKNIGGIVVIAVGIYNLFKR